MDHRRLGRSGLWVSELALGTMNFGSPTDRAESFRIVDLSIDSGINLFDCADVYAQGESERILGEALKREGKRQSVFVTSKCFMPTGPGPNDRGNSRHHILNACHASLDRLQTDYIDLYFLHRTDWNLPQEEALAALNHLVDHGMVRYVGCSTHPAWRTVEALHVADRYGYPKFTSEQLPYNLLDRRIENEIVPMCMEYDLGILAWSPLAQGTLAGNYTDAEKMPTGSRGAQKNVFQQRITKEGIAVAGKLISLAERKSTTTVRLAVSWVLHQPGITAVLLGPRTPGHLSDLLGATEVALDASDLAACDALVAPGDYVSDHFNTAGWNTGRPSTTRPRW